MVTWNNLDTLASFKELSKMERVNLVEAMSGGNGADLVKNYSLPMAGGFSSLRLIVSQLKIENDCFFRQ